MADEVSLEMIQSLAQQALEELKGMRRDTRDLTLRLGRMEIQIADVGVQIAHMSVRLDHVGERLERLEQRSGLIGA